MSIKLTAAINNMNSTLEFISDTKPAAWYSKDLLEGLIFNFARLLWSEPNHTNLINTKLSELDSLLS